MIVKIRKLQFVIFLSITSFTFVLIFWFILKVNIADKEYQLDDKTSSIVIKTSFLYESGHLDFPSQLCPNNGEEIKLLIVITSAPAHRENRLAIRQTWGHFGTRRDIGIAFVVGTAGPQLDDALAAENDLYNDIIRGRFVDSYNNLTLKTISMLEWVDVYCSKAAFILKTDDDMFINIPKLLQIIEKKTSDKRTIYGHLVCAWKPVRNRKSRYFVGIEQFRDDSLPCFVTGPAYLMTRDCIRDLYVKALGNAYLKLEDVFLTGIVAELLEIKRKNLSEFWNQKLFFKGKNVGKYVSIHGISQKEQFELWKKLIVG